MSAQQPDESRSERAAAARAQEARQNRNRKIGFGVMVPVILGAVVAAAVWTNDGSGATLPTVHNTVTTSEGAVVVGKASARVKITIYEDFLCADCRQLEESTRDYLRQNASDGTVQVTYHPVAVLTASTYSARALNAWAAVLLDGTPEQALRLHDLLYDNQPYANAADATTDADIAGLVARTGATSRAVTSALSTTDAAFLAAAHEAAVAAGVAGEPTVYLNGTKLPAGSVTDLVTRIENAVDAAS